MALGIWRSSLLGTRRATGSPRCELELRHCFIGGTSRSSLLTGVSAICHRWSRPGVGAIAAMLAPTLQDPTASSTPAATTPAPPPSHCQNAEARWRQEEAWTRGYAATARDPSD